MASSHKLVVKEGNPRFEARPHAHFVQPHQKQLRQAQIQIEVGHPLDRSLFPRILQKPFMDRPYRLPGALAAEAAPQPGRKHVQLAALGEGVCSTPKNR